MEFTSAQLSFNHNVTFNPPISLSANMHFQPKVNWQDLYLPSSADTTVELIKEEPDPWHWNMVVIIPIGLIFLTVTCSIIVIAMKKSGKRANSN